MRFLPLRYSFFFIACILTILGLLIYTNTIFHQFAVVDDLQGIVENQEIKQLSTTISTFIFGRIVGAFLIAIFGLNPLPFHVVSVTSHIIAAWCVYLFLRIPFGEKRAALASILFTIHPANTEAVNWLSAQSYIFSAIIIYLLFYFQSAYIKKPNNRYVWLLGGTYLFFIIFFRSAWVIAAPCMLFIYAFFVEQHKLRFSQYKKILFILTAGLLLYLIVFLPSSFGHRIAMESEMSGKSALNQQQLIPIIEGYPYSLYKMILVYVWPASLSIYDDGSTITTGLKLLFFSVSALYISLASFFLYQKQYRIFGLLLLLPACVAPVFSPIKITWFMAERYLYLGTPFFCLLIIYFLQYLQKLVRWRYFFPAIFIAYSLTLTLRTVTRNRDWQTPETLALATIRTSPLSIRPYNDLAGYYFLKGDIKKSKLGFKKTLTIGPSLVAMNNLGLIYMKHGLDPQLHAIDISSEEALNQAKSAISSNQYRLALFYLNEVYRQKPNNISALLYIAHTYIELGKLDLATQFINKAQAADPENADVWFVKGYLSFKKNQLENARESLQHVLKLNPGHEAAKQNLLFIMETMKKNK